MKVVLIICLALAVLMVMAESVTVRRRFKIHNIYF